MAKKNGSLGKKIGVLAELEAETGFGNDISDTFGHNAATSVLGVNSVGHRHPASGTGRQL